ncbi:hypothetical protein HNR74_003471 [Flammeovirga kamogawensis]|nr:hypothetical protein [Flammeovirga kamogawensis]
MSSCGYRPHSKYHNALHDCKATSIVFLEVGSMISEPYKSKYNQLEKGIDKLQ